MPLALDVAVRDGRIKRGDLLVLEAMGGGFTWGAAALHIEAKKSAKLNCGARGFAIA